jgi:hypothetical protein
MGLGLRLRLLVGILLLAGLGMSPSAPAAGSKRAAKKGKTMDETPHAFTLKVTCDRSYLSGFPMMVAVEIRNVSKNHHALLPFFDLFTVPGPVSFVLRGDGHEWTWHTRSRRTDDGPEGMEFGPGRAWFALQDLSEQHPELPAGHYELSASYVFPGEVVRSAPVSVSIRTSTPHDRAIAAKLRRTNDEGESSWRAFVRDNWSTPDATGLSKAARAALAFHLYLHRAAYGPEPVRALDPEEPWSFGHGVLESQAALIRLEILRAAGKPQATGVEAAVRERWPALYWWVEQIDQNSGLLTRLRNFHGIDSSYAPKDKPRPYQPPR